MFPQRCLMEMFVNGSNWTIVGVTASESFFKLFLYGSNANKILDILFHFQTDIKFSFLNTWFTLVYIYMRIRFCKLWNFTIMSTFRFYAKLDISYFHWSEESSESRKNIFGLANTLWYMVSSISFQTFFVQAFKIVIDSWKLSMLLLYILWDD